MNTFFSFFQAKFKQIKSVDVKGFSRNPFFYFGVMSLALFGLLCFGSGSLAVNNYQDNTDHITFNPFFKTANAQSSDNLFFTQHSGPELETPDLKIIQGNSLAAVSTPTTLTTQTLGDIFGGSDETRKDVTEYTVQIGDTVDSIAKQFEVSSETIAWANNISKSSTLKIGQTITILPFSGVIHVVKNGDTIEQIVKTYSTKTSQVKIDDIVADNGLDNPQNIFIGDILQIRNGIMPSKPIPPTLVPLAKSFLKLPLLNALITQGLHYYNAVDLASKCGDYVYAAAGGVVLRAGYDRIGGNRVTILHSNGVVTYYGHLQFMFVKPGDIVTGSSAVGLEGKTGQATGCHVHFEVIGAQNPFAKFARGTHLNINSNY